jgi:23S rRNA pseudouridine2605 synthase
MSRKRPHRSPGQSRREGEPEERDGGGVGPERLQKVLAAAGVGSRRDCEELIREGRVEVDRKVVTELGTRVDPLAHEIRVDGEALRRPKRVYFAVNKPAGVVTTNYDPSGRPRVVDLVPTEERVFAVGRLDRASEGLILVTNDGEFANRLTHPRYGVTKTYLVRVAGSPTQAELAKLRRGVHLAEGYCKVESLQVKGKHKGSTDMIIVLSEGRNREIRRILARVGHKVLDLRRLAVGRLKLSDLPLGAWRRLMPAEINGLMAEAKERKREQRRPKKPAGPARPVQGEREATPHLQQQAVMAGPPLDEELDDAWEGSDDFLAGDDEALVEISDGSSPPSGPPPLGDVIDYDEPTRKQRPDRNSQPTRTPRPARGERPARGSRPSRTPDRPPGRGRAKSRGPSYGKKRTDSRRGPQEERGPQKNRPQKGRPPKSRRKGRR